MVTKAIRSEWQPDAGVLVVYGEDGDSNQGIAIPIAALPALAGHARRFLAGASAKQTPHAGAGDWVYAQHCTAQTYDVGVLPTTTGEKVSLILDRGQDTQIGFAIEPEHAQELGRQLTDTAAQASNTPQAKN